MIVKKLIYIIPLLVVILVLLILPILKLFLFDRIREENNKKQLIILVNSYFDKEEYGLARNLTENLLFKHSDDKELIELLDKILQAERNAIKPEEARTVVVNYPRDTSDLERLTDLYNMLLKEIGDLKNTRFSNIEKVEEKPRIIEGKPKEIIVEKKEKTIDEIEVERLIDEGIAEYNEKNYPEAKDFFIRALKMDEKNPYANAYLGASLYEENPENDKGIEEATRRCKIALEENNSLEIAHFILANIYNLKKIKDAAIPEYEETLGINPNNYIAAYFLGKIYFENKEYANAEIYFKNTIEIKNDYINGYIFLAETEFYLGYIELSKQYLEKVLSINSDFYHCYLKLAEIAVYESKYADAIGYYEKALKIDKNYIYYYKIGECYDVLSKIDNAVFNYNTAISLNPLKTKKQNNDAVESYKKIVQIKKREEKYKEALSILEKGIEKLGASSFTLHQISGDIKKDLKDYENAIKDYTKAVELESDSKEIYLIYYKIASCYEALGKARLAINLYNKSIQRNPDYMESYYELIKINVSENKIDDARLLLNLLIERNPQYEKRAELESLVMIK